MEFNVRNHCFQKFMQKMRQRLVPGTLVLIYFGRSEL